MMTSGISTHEQYLASVAEDRRPALEKLRAYIRSAAPDAVEVISYQLPAYRLGKMLVAYGATKKHCAFYLMSSTVLDNLDSATRTEVEKFDISKGTIRFQPEKIPSKSLVRKLVFARIAENS